MSIAQPTVEKSEIIHHTKWIQLKTDTIVDPQGRRYEWTYINRTTKFRETDGVAVFAKVTGRAYSEPHVLVIAQWRPPTRQWVLELPAGLIAPGESVESVAARELKEETGYACARVESVSPEVYNDQGTSTSALNLAVATVDADAPENAAPAPEHEVGETIQTLVLPIRGLAARLRELKAARGWGVCSRLYSLALGLEIGAAGGLL